QKSTTITTDAQGHYRVADLAPGLYQANATAPGFATRTSTAVKIITGQVVTLDIALSIEMSQQTVTVTEEPTAIEVNPANNASATIVSGKSLEALSDDPDELQTDLMALAGMAAGPNGPQMYVDGFTNGQPPPKSTIREIRVNHNPFSAQYDSPGYGRIEILTKPGADHWHGNVQVTGNTESFNAQNPFLDTPPPGYYSTTYRANVGGAISKKASVSFDMFRRNIQDLAVIDTPGALDFGILPVNTAVPNPRTRMDLNPRLDYQINPSNTLTVSYEYWRDADGNSGLGQFSLPSLAYNTVGTEQTLRVSDTQTIGAFFENETRFKFERDGNDHNALSSAPTLNVEGYFNGGGNSQGTANSVAKHYQFLNYSTFNHKKHQLGFGLRARGVNYDSYSTAGFNGTFIFNSPADYAAGNPYQFTQTALLPGGSPNTGVSLFDVGLYIQDDWKVRPNLTLSGGLRFESQTAIHDRADWAPRFGVSWGLGNKDEAKTVIRAGWGIFYDRFTDDLLLNAKRLDGTRQQSYVLYGTAASPLSFYPNLPTAAELANAQSSIATTYQISPGLRSPYLLQTSIGVEQQITRKGNVSVSYVNSRGEHQFYTNNINSPLPSTYNYLDPTSLSGADRPNGINENIFQYESDGIYRENQVLVNGNLHAGSKLTIFGNYALSSAHSDAVGPNSFPSNPYNIRQDYGRAAFDSRHHLFMGGMVGLPRAFQLFPFMIYSSGKPYNIVLGQDLNGSTVLNQRPAFASSLSDPANVVTTQYGAFDTVPVEGETPIPYNYLDGPGYFSLNLRLSKTFGFGGESRDAGPEKPPSPGHRERAPRATDRRYQLQFSVNARNLLNVVNKGEPAAILNPPHRDSSDPNTIVPASVSPLFGISNSLANSATANRIVYLSAGFSF
ncbi:MAG TPA: TonB-dependent receptor, partial [Terriglobales bacterium]|nr:TonB-dependent receptor [Terriglobales bacterium]